MTESETQSGSRSRSPRVARKRKERQLSILRSAAVVFAEVGYHGASLEDIAERLDLTRASLYHYFPSKDALLSACLEVGAQNAMERLEGSLADSADRPAAERLMHLIEAQLDTTCRQDPELSRLFLTPIDWPESIRDLVRKLREDHDRCFRQVIDEGIESGEFGTTDPVTARHCLHGAMNYVPVWLPGKERNFAARARGIAESLILLLEPQAVPATT